MSKTITTESDKKTSRAERLDKIPAFLAKGDKYVVISLDSDGDEGFTSKLKTDIPLDILPDLLRWLIEELEGDNQDNQN